MEVSGAAVAELLHLVRIKSILEANRDGTIKKLGLKWFAADGSPPLPAASAATR